MINYLGQPISLDELAEALREYYESPVSLLGSDVHTGNRNQLEAEL